jgi:hypothetical protein
VSDVGKFVDLIARVALAEPLKAAGYRKDGRTWRRRTDESVLVVNVQSSRWNDQAEGQFTLNVGVYFPALAEQLAIYPVTDKPAECDCHLRQRPVMLSTGGLDTWWKVSPADSEDKISAIGAEVRAIFQMYAQPWLDRLKDLAAAKDELVRKKNLWWASAACLVLGNHEEAKTLLKGAIQEGQRQDIQERLQRWGEDRGLLEEKR